MVVSNVENMETDEEMQTDPPAEDHEAEHESEDEDGWRICDDIIIPRAPHVFGEVDTKRARLMIDKIMVYNFKSYGGKIEIGPFHKYFSAIVGPNGNGKSNAIDAMLFVFGYRANKIRSKKIAELIHKSNEHPNCTSCSVSVHFKEIFDMPGQAYEVVPNSHFVVSRTAHRDGSSYYELNGKRVQFKEIGKLFRSHHVDLDHNRFLILQGEVEQIALMKPKGNSEGDVGMLEFLEDIIGTKRYEEPLAKLFQRVELLTEEREEKLRRLKVVEKAKTELEGPMQEAVEFLELENEIIQWQHKYYQCKKYETENKLKEEEESKKELDNDYQNLITELKNVQSSKEEKTKELKEKTKKWDKIQQEKDSLAATFDEIRKKDEALHAESVATNKRRKENISTVKNEKTKLEDLQKVPAKNRKDIEECEALAEKHAADLQKEEASLVTLMSGLNEKVAPLSQKRSSLENELVALKSNVDKAQSSYKIAKSKLDLYTANEQTEKNKLLEIQESMKTTAEKLVERKKQIASFDQKIPATEKSLNQAHQELQVIMEKEQEANTKSKAASISSMK